MEKFEIEAQGDSEYRVQIDSRDGRTAITVRLADAKEATGGRLADDDATAAAVIRFLLRHQDPSDLPPLIEIEDVMAAYPDAVDEIEALRG